MKQSGRVLSFVPSFFKSNGASKHSFGFERERDIRETDCKHQQEKILSILENKTPKTRADRMAKSKTSAPALEDESKKPLSSETVSEDAGGSSDDDNLYGFIWVSVCGYAIYRIIYYSYRIRMGAIDEYGPVIHEFDPYFNYRATEVRKQNRKSKARFLNIDWLLCILHPFVHLTFRSSILLPVSLRARRLKVFSVVRLQGLVSTGTTRWDHHISRHAVYGRIHQAVFVGWLVPE